MPKNEISQAYRLPTYRTDSTVDELGKMPFGILIGNILSACVDAQTQAANTAWDYTRKLLEREEPIVFNFRDEEGMKSLSVPLFTIVPLPYLKLDNVDINFDAEASTDSDHQEDFLITVNNNVTEGNATHVVKGKSNMHIDIHAGSTDLPAGLAMLLKYMGGSLLIEDAPKVISSGGIDFDTFIDRLKQRAENVTYLFDNATGTDYLGTPLKAIHVNWTKPAAVDKGAGWQYGMEEYDILSTILSALLWRKLNGPIKLYTDTFGLAYYERMGMTDLWNGGIDTEVLDNIPSDIPADIFWAGGKIYAIQKEDGPFVMMDTDLMVWQSLTPLIKDYQTLAFHPESMESYESGYLPLEMLKTPPRYTPDSSWDWTQNPVNTALTYYAGDWGTKSFKKYYTDSAIKFMRGNTQRPKEMVSQMIFAEQRLYAMCAKKQFGKVPTFLAFPEEEDRPFSHIWGNKAYARDNAEAGRMLCGEMTRIILTLFPQYPFSTPIKKILNKYNN